MAFCVHCGKNTEGSKGKVCPHCGKPPYGERSSLPAIAIAFGLVGFFVAAGAVGLHLKKVSPPTAAVTTAATATATATVTPTASASAEASATPTENQFAGTWTGEPTEKGDVITVVVDNGPLPVSAHYKVGMKDGGEYSRGNLKVVANAKRPNDQIDGTNGSEVYFRVGLDKGEMYGWVEVIRLTLGEKGVVKHSAPEQPDFTKLQRTGDPEPYVSPLETYGVPEYSDAESLGSWMQEIEGTSTPTYGYTSNASLTDLHSFYESELPKVETQSLEKGNCKMRFQGEGDPVFIEIIENDSFRRVEIWRKAL